MSEAAAPPRVPLWRQPWVLRWAVFLGLFALLEAATRGGFIDPLTVVPPTVMFQRLLAIIPTASFATDLSRTLFTIVTAFLIGCAVGIPLGTLFWRIPAVGRVLEPFLVTMYAMPTLVFYPILLALMGLNAGPIIAIAAVMSLIPIALQTMVALNSINPLLHKLSQSLNCTQRQYYLKILVPAATPLAIPGLKLGFIYAIIGTIAMEFILASRGIGFRAGLGYREFQIADMYAYILVVVLLSVLVNYLLTALERRIRRDML